MTKLSTRTVMFLTVLVVVPIACNQIDSATECVSDDDCAQNGSCINGVCEGEDTDTFTPSTQKDTLTAPSVPTAEETDAGIKECVVSPTDIATSQIDQTQGDCCADPQSLESCWWEDALNDGVTCQQDGECPSGSCDTTRGVCHCSDQNECRQGYCNMDKGYCGPSLCNGYQICSCWGGCAAVEMSNTDACCEGAYSLSFDAWKSLLQSDQDGGTE